MLTQILTLVQSSRFHSHDLHSLPLFWRTRTEKILLKQSLLTRNSQENKLNTKKLVFIYCFCSSILCFDVDQATVKSREGLRRLPNENALVVSQFVVSQLSRHYILHSVSTSENCCLHLLFKEEQMITCIAMYLCHIFTAVC